MYGVVYKITNTRNGKPYVGQTTRPIKERFREHARCRKSLIGKAIRKYGAENFTFEVLEECENAEQLNEREIFWIAELNCKSPNGYNISDGGEGHMGWTHTPEACAKISATNRGEKNPFYGKHHTDETKAKMSAAKCGRKLSPETRAKISAAKCGRKFSPETRAKISAANSGRKLSPETRAKISASMPRKREVICLETGEKFPTISQAAKWLGMVTGAVSRSCRKHYAAGGYHFRYADEISES